MGPRGDPIATPPICWYSFPSGHLKGASLVQSSSSLCKIFGGIFGGVIVGWLYTCFRIISIVSSMGTLVNRLSTSSEPIIPLHLLELIKSRKSLVDLIVYWLGVKGEIILLRYLAKLYVGVGICDIIGRSGLPSLWIFTLLF